MGLPLVGVSNSDFKRFAGMTDLSTLVLKYPAAMLVVRVLRVARVARIFKLARYSSGLQTIGDTMIKSAKVVK